MKLVQREPETVALWRLLRDWPERVSSIVAQIELGRVARRSPRQRTVRRAGTVTARLDLVWLTEDIVASASTIGPPALRALDAVHLATALSLGDDLAAMVVYDQRLAEAAASAGVRTLAPAEG